MLLRLLTLSVLVAVITPWPSNHPWSQAILQRRRPDIRRYSCEPLRCMNGAYIPTCDMYGRQLAYVQSPCRGR